MLLKIGIILTGICILIGQFIRQARRKRQRDLRELEFSLGLTGAQFAERILDVKGVEGVEIVESRALLTDFYEPASRTLRLSPENYHGTDLAAVGMAAHEAGHAIQNQSNHSPLGWRNSAIKFTIYGTALVFLGCIPLLILYRQVGLMVLGVSWALILLQNLITLPVEIDASARVKDVIYDGRILRRGKEGDKLEEMLGAATLDKVSGFVRFWDYIFSWIFPWRRRRTGPR